MKKILFTAVSALAFAGFADGVASTEFGAMKVESSTKQTVVSVPWLESGTGSENVSVSNLVLTAGISDNDTLDLFDPAAGTSGAYTSHYQYQKALGRWVKTDGSATTIPRGSALLLTRSGSEHSLSDGFYIMGKPSDAGATINLATSKDYVIYSLIAPPSVNSAGTNVNTGMTWNNLEIGDQLAIKEANGSVKYYGWSQTSARGITPKTYAWVDATTGEQVDAVIPLGQGAWFISKKTTQTAKKTAQFN